MNQKELRELESRCIQEEAPTCAARCPIHVDVKKFLKKASAGAWNDAVEALAVAMPFPAILGRICDHPCESRCRREEAGDAIAISAVEKVVIEKGRIRKRRIPLPQKDTRVAIAGGGLSGLTAANDLAYKGYGVTLFQKEERLGDGLGKEISALVPPEVIEEEMKVLSGMKVRVEAIPDEDDPVGALRGRFDALYMEMDAGALPVDALTLAGPDEGVFVGTRNLPSPIDAVAQGRKAAVSIDRFLQKVSLTAGREKEGPYETKLFTSLVEVKPEPGVCSRTCNDEEAMREAARCLQCECMECVKACVFLEKFKAYPKQYVRQISNNATIVLGNHGQINRLINSCSLCGLCAEICPTGLDMAKVCLDGRKSLTERGKMPPSVHDFALGDMASANSDKSAFASHEPGKEESAFAFFPGCQVGATNPDHVIRAYAYLRSRLEGGVGLIDRCCGAPAEWAGREDLFREALDALLADWEALGKPRLITACPACYKVLKENCPQVQTVTLWEMIGEDVLAGGTGKLLAVHDPCTTRHEPAIRADVRRILKGLGCEVEELDFSGERTECCGFGGLMAASDPSLAKEVARKRASRSNTDYVTYCAMCRDSLARSGKTVVHVLDLLFGGSTQERPGPSDRRENRYRLRERLKKEVWGGQGRTMEEYEGIALYIAAPVWELLEERRILAEDIRKTIAYAEKEGTRFLNRDTGHWLASLKPGHVTYWVEYSEEADGFRIHDAYSHRMELAGN